MPTANEIQDELDSKLKHETPSTAFTGPISARELGYETRLSTKHGLLRGQVSRAVDHCGLCHSNLSILNNDWSISSFESVHDELVGVEVTNEIDDERNQI